MCILPLPLNNLLCELLWDSKKNPVRSRLEKPHMTVNNNMSKIRNSALFNFGHYLSLSGLNFLPVKGRVWDRLAFCRMKIHGGKAVFR